MSNNLVSDFIYSNYLIFARPLNSNKMGSIFTALLVLFSVIVVLIPCGSVITHFLRERGLSEKTSFGRFFDFGRHIPKDGQGSISPLWVRIHGV